MINIDHVATLRNARQEQFPDPVHAAVIAEQAGADGIVFHPREDRRHITDRDVYLLKQVVHKKLDFELSMADEVVALCCEIQPHLATLVPERMIVEGLSAPLHPGAIGYFRDQGMM